MRRGTSLDLHSYEISNTFFEDANYTIRFVKSHMYLYMLYLILIHQPKKVIIQDLIYLSYIQI